MRRQHPTQPAHQAPTTTQAVQAVLAEQGTDWPVVGFQTLTIIQALMEDGHVEYRLVRPQDQPIEVNTEILAGAAEASGIEITSHRCICGASSPSPLCPDFPDCLPGGES